jgi:hypothetical protein
MVRQKFEAALMEIGIEGAAAHAWLTMNGIASLVTGGPVTVPPSEHELQDLN